MGQLERYGLYVLCLVIFLILGVAIWGSDPQELNHSRVAAGGDDTPRVKSEEDHILGLENYLAGQTRKTIGKQKAAENAVFRRADSRESVGRPVKDRGAQARGARGAGGTSAKPPVAPVVRPRSHVVADGDNFSSLAQHYLGNAKYWPRIQAANPSLDSNNLKIGVTVIIPALAQVRSKVGPKVSPDGGEMYQVGPGENPWVIASRLVGVAKAPAYAKRMLKLNNIVDERKIGKGRWLKLPAR